MANMLFEMNEWLSHPDRILAVVGGAAVGGFGLPWLFQMAVRGWTRQQVPAWMMMSLRVVIGGLSGWLVMLWLFASGGGGLGGPGGVGFGGGTDKGDSKPVVQSPKPRDDTQPPPADFTQDVTTLYVEILSTETVKMIDPTITDPLRCYRVQTPDGPRLRTLKEVEDYLKQRVTEKPALKNLTIVLYKDSPDRNVPKVRELADAASVLSVAGSDTRLSVGYSEPRKNAPL